MLLNLSSLNILNTYNYKNKNTVYKYCKRFMQTESSAVKGKGRAPQEHFYEVPLKDTSSSSSSSSSSRSRVIQNDDIDEDDTVVIQPTSPVVIKPNASTISESPVVIKPNASTISESPVVLLQPKRIEGVVYDAPKKQPDIESTGNITIDDCVSTNPLKILRDNLEDCPATKSLYDNLSLATSYLQVLLPTTEQNVQAAAEMTERAKATFQRVEALEKSLARSWWDRKLTWAVAIASTLSLIRYMIYTRSTPSLPATIATPTVVEIVKATLSSTKDTVTSTSKKVAEHAPTNTGQLFLDHPLTCATIIGCTIVCVVGLRSSLRVVKWTMSKFLR